MNIENPRPHPSCVYYSLKPLPYQFSQRFGGEHPKKKLGLPSLAKCPVEKARTSLTNHAKRGMRSGLSEKKAIPNELMVEPNLPRHSMANHQGFFPPTNETISIWYCWLYCISLYPHDGGSILIIFPIHPINYIYIVGWCWLMLVVLYPNRDGEP